MNTIVSIYITFRQPAKIKVWFNEDIVTEILLLYSSVTPLNVHLNTLFLNKINC